MNKNALALHLRRSHHKSSPTVFGEAIAWATAFDMEDRKRKGAIRLRKKLTDRLIGELRRSIYRGNGDFLRDLADAVEDWQQSPRNRLDYVLINLFFVTQDHSSFCEQKFRLTAETLKNRLSVEGIKNISIRHIRRRCKFFGIELDPVKVGRKKAHKKIIRTR